MTFDGQDWVQPGSARWLLRQDIDRAISALKEGLLFAVAYEAGVYEGAQLLTEGANATQRSAWQAVACEVTC
jgi:hypothetical protein